MIISRRSPRKEWIQRKKIKRLRYKISEYTTEEEKRGGKQLKNNFEIKRP